MSRFGDVLPHNLPITCLTGWYKNFKGLFLRFFVCGVTALSLCRAEYWYHISHQPILEIGISWYWNFG